MKDEVSRAELPKNIFVLCENKWQLVEASHEKNIVSISAMLEQ